MQNSQTLSTIKIQIFSILPGCRIVLFGSRARNENTEESDYDLLIITKTTMPISEKREFRSKIRKSLISYDILSDIIIESEQEILNKKQLTGHIVKNAIEEGVEI